MISHLQAGDKVVRCTPSVEVHPWCCYKCYKRSDDDAHLTSAFIERTTGGNGTQDMRVGDSLQLHAWYVWNAGVVLYKVQCGHADTSEWHVWYAWNAGVTSWHIGTLRATLPLFSSNWLEFSYMQ